jgi:hypothetical protein
VAYICFFLLSTEYRQLCSIYVPSCLKRPILCSEKCFWPADDNQEKDVTYVLPEAAALREFDPAHSDSAYLAALSICSNLNG